MPRSSPPQLPAAGWREWVALPDLGIVGVKAKLDTGARTSALHAFNIEPYRAGGRDRIRFEVHPMQRSSKKTVQARAVVLDQRSIKSSSGHSHERYVIETELQLGDESWPIELTLASRDEMGFRLLLGRQAVRARVLVDPGSSYQLSKALKKQMRKARKSR